MRLIGVGLVLNKDKDISLMIEIKVCHSIELKDMRKNSSFKSVLSFMLCKVI